MTTDYPTVKNFDNVYKLDTNKKPDKTTLKVWNLGKDLDLLILDAITETKLEPELIAAVIANRLREAIKASGNEKLLDHCIKILSLD